MTITMSLTTIKRLSHVSTCASRQLLILHFTVLNFGTTQNAYLNLFFIATLLNVSLVISVVFHFWAIILHWSNVRCYPGNYQIVYRFLIINVQHYSIIVCDI